MHLGLQEVAHSYPLSDSERPAARRSSAGVVRRRRGVKAPTPEKPSEVPAWLVRAYGAPLLSEGERARNIVLAKVVEGTRTDEGARVLWSRVLDALHLAGSRLVGGTASWQAVEGRQQLLALAELSQAERRRRQAEARRARHHAQRGDRFPAEDEHARAVFAQTLQTSVPNLPFVVVAALAWWLRLLPRSMNPFDPSVQLSEQRLADRHWG